MFARTTSRSSTISGVSGGRSISAVDAAHSSEPPFTCSTVPVTNEDMSLKR